MDLDSEVTRSQVLFPLRVTFFTGFFLISQSKASDGNISLLPTLFNYEKTRICIAREVRNINLVIEFFVSASYLPSLAIVDTVPSWEISSGETVLEVEVNYNP